mmetsp:Transcript_11310/g.20679  ORF Transcript_11310/g.20679 Transcript_11310/m.20679 type:complete len:368 (-) Transcript_11310:130-1233(-)
MKAKGPQPSHAWSSRSQWGQETGVEFVDAAGDTNLLVIGANGLDLYVNGHRRVENLIEVKLSGDDSRSLLFCQKGAPPAPPARALVGRKSSSSSASPPSQIKTKVREGEEEVVLRLLALGQKSPLLDRDHEVASVAFIDADGEQNLLCVNRFGRIDLYIGGQRRGHDLLTVHREPPESNRLLLRHLSTKRDVVLNVTQETSERVMMLFQTRIHEASYEGYVDSSTGFLDSATAGEAAPGTTVSNASTSATEITGSGADALPLRVLHDRLIEAGNAKWPAEQDEESGSPSSSWGDDLRMSSGAVSDPASILPLPQPCRDLLHSSADRTPTQLRHETEAAAQTEGCFLESSLVPVSDIFQKGAWLQNHA